MTSTTERPATCPADRYRREHAAALSNAEVFRGTDEGFRMLEIAAHWRYALAKHKASPVCGH